MEGDQLCLKIVVERLWRMSKSTMPIIKLPETGSKEETAGHIIAAMSSGEVSPDQALVAVQVLRGSAELVEIQEILERLQQLESGK